MHCKDTPTDGSNIALRNDPIPVIKIATADRSRLSNSIAENVRHDRQVYIQLPDKGIIFRSSFEEMPAGYSASGTLPYLHFITCDIAQEVMMMVRP